MSATGCRVSSKRPEPFMKCWNQKRRGTVNLSSFSIISTNLLSQTYNQPMHSSPRRPFLEHFKDRHQPIGKYGLLQLLQQHHQQSLNQQPPRPHQHSKLLIQTPLKQQAQPQFEQGRCLKPARSVEINREIPKTDPQQYKESSQRTSQRYNKAESSRQLQAKLSNKQLQAKVVKLPSIGKSSSLSTHSRKPRTEVTNGDVTGTSGLSQARPYRQHESIILNGSARKMELDSYALRHLEFMQKFQKQLLHNQITSKLQVREKKH